MKILLLGCNGQVGWELQRSLAPLGSLVALDVDSAPWSADFTRPGPLEQMVRAMAPDVIVNAAACTAVDRCEAEPELARTLNAAAPAALARQARASGAWLVHYSSDHVFDGSGDAPWEEDAAPGPLNTYGRTKLEGELAIRDSGCRHLILRTSWVYAARGGNFARTLLRLAAQRDSLDVVDDQWGAPTGAELLADVTAHALRAAAAAADASLGGTYHVAAAGQTSRYGYARHVVECARAAGWPLRAGPDAVRPVPSGAVPAAALRPLNSRLDTRKLRAAFRLELPDWRLGVERMLREVGERQGER